MGVVRLVRSRAQPHVIIQFSRNGFGSQVFLAHPIELPSESGSSRNGHLQRPSQQTAVHELLQRLYRCTQAIEVVLETEPGVQAEDAVVLLHGLHHPFAFADGTCHRLLTPDVLARLGRFDSHQGMPMRRRGDMHHIHIRVLYQVAEVVIGLQSLVELLLAHFHGLLQVILIYIANRHQSALLVAGEMIATSTDTAYPDDTLGELVARCDVLRAPQYLCRHDGEQPDSTHCFEKISSVGSHSICVFICFSNAIYSSTHPVIQSEAKDLDHTK